MKRASRKRVGGLALVLAAAMASVASANVWDDAIARGQPDPAKDKFDSEMRSGDEHAMLANTRSSSKKEVLHQLQLALTSYRAAAAAKPDSAEPFFRIGELLQSFFLECDDKSIPQHLMSKACEPRFDRARAGEAIAAWEDAERRAPRDPRFGVSVLGISEILFRRAILHTKLAQPPGSPSEIRAHLADAAEDYEKILARQDHVDGAADNVVSNLAETYMMLGRLEDAINTYRQAIKGAGDTSTWYGYAVALDRDEQGELAMDVIRALGPDQRAHYRQSVMLGNTFYVPEGEKFYYFALVDEAFNDTEEAIENWRRFINSGAHPEFQPRAKHHLDNLLSKKRKGTLPFDPKWRGILP